jgi:DNA-binding response OmpR family regulator
MRHEQEEKMFPEPRTAASSVTVLLVDDDRRLLKAVTTRLQDAGCRCIACGNAAEAMNRFALGGIDLVITDMTMPSLDGLSVVAMIRGQSDVPILVVTGHADDYLPVLRQYPGVTVMGKPFEPRALIKFIREALTRRRAA